MSCGLFALGVVGNLLSWPLMTICGRRAAYIWTCCITTVLMYVLGSLGLAPDSDQGAMYANAVMMLLFYLVYNNGLGPVVYVLIAELPSSRIRGRTLGVACFTPHIFSISITAGLPYAMSTTEANWGSKTGFLFAGLSTLVVLWAFFCLPETKGRTFEELDILSNVVYRLGDLQRPISRILIVAESYSGSLSSRWVTRTRPYWRRTKRSVDDVGSLWHSQPCGFMYVTCL